MLLARRRASRPSRPSRYLLVRRNEKIMGFIAPIASATLGLRRAHHGLRLLGLTMVIWAIEAGVWMSTGAAVGFGMTPIEGLYIVALASIFAMIPSGPAYAGTQDAAAIIGIKALGGTSAQAVAYVVMLRFVIVVPITLAGLVAARHALRRPRQAAHGPCLRLAERRAAPRAPRREPRRAPPARRADRLGRARGARARAAAATTSAPARSTTTRARTPTSPGSSRPTATTSTTRCCTGRCAST